MTTNTTSITFLCPDDLNAAIRRELSRLLNENPQAKLNRTTVILDALRAHLMPKNEPSEKPDAVRSSDLDPNDRNGQPWAPANPYNKS